MLPPTFNLQEFEIHQIEMKLMTYNHKYHFKVRQKSSLGRRTMFDISNKLIDCGSDFNSQIRYVSYYLMFTITMV